MHKDYYPCADDPWVQQSGYAVNKLFNSQVLLEKMLPNEALNLTIRQVSRQTLGAKHPKRGRNQYLPKEVAS
ncbi:MAG: hypothetical protein WCO56_18480 [Verrucomicrobiota bacterium]